MSGKGTKITSLPYGVSVVAGTINKCKGPSLAFTGGFPFFSEVRSNRNP